MAIIYRRPQIYKERTPIDASTLINWRMDESALPFKNTGNGGTLNLVANEGSPTPQTSGLFNYAVGLNNNSTAGTIATNIEPNTTATTYSF